MTLLVAFGSATLSGCKGAAGNAPPTAEAAAAFKGAAPTAEDREAMKKEEAAAAEYRRTHPKEFPPENQPAAPNP